jgi:hypothetical protein
MNRADAILLAQMVKAMNDLMTKLEEAYAVKDLERFEAIKKEMLSLQKKIDSIT